MIDPSQTTNDTAALFASLSGKQTKSSASSASEVQDRFLKLLVTQMKNQDPLNPMDNAQVTSQMAQLSTVSGIDKLNSTLQALSDNVTASQSMQASSMIGHGVLVPGSGVALTNGGAYGGIDLPQSVDKLDIAIYDQSGVLVRNMRMGPQSVGLMSWQWDGRNDAGAAMPDGRYTYAVTAAQGATKVDAVALQFGQVTSVTQGKQGATLGIGQLEGIAMSDVRKIF
jgi:flagellar basal-body rod modification protein FlgD